MERRAAAQLSMRYARRGGARVGAGRPKKRDAGPSHAKRPALSGREPVHVTLRVLEHVYNLRARRCFEVIFAAMLACCSRENFRVVGLSIQGHHLHLLIEAANAAALARGIQAVAIRIAKGLNRVMGRRGRVFQRFHARRLKTPREVRAAMAYIARNTAKHAAQVGRVLPAEYRDPCTVGYFGARTLLPPGAAGMVAEPRTWLARFGWQRRASAPPTPVSAGHTTPIARRSPGCLLPLLLAGGARPAAPPEVPRPHTVCPLERAA